MQMNERMRGVLAAVAAVALGAAVACSETRQAPLSPSGTLGSADAAADGSTLKVSAPTLISPIGGARVDTRKPTFSFGSSSGRYVSTTPAYRLELLDASTGAVLGAQVLSAGQTAYTVDADLAADTTYAWRVRAEIDTAFGPWSSAATFQTPASFVATPPPTGGGDGTLPFPVPTECGAGYSVSNRIACVNAISRVSAEWAACARGNGVSCHKFTRQVVYSLAQTDPAWRMIIARPGGKACDCNQCTDGIGNGRDYLREDTTSNNGRVFDMISGAGGPTPGLMWSEASAGLSGQGTTPAVLCR